jgi:hypothetical protein
MPGGREGSYKLEWKWRLRTLVSSTRNTRQSEKLPYGHGEFCCSKARHVSDMLLELEVVSGENEVS